MKTATKKAQRREVRKYTDVLHHELKDNNDDTFSLTVVAKTENGRQVMITLREKFDQLPYWVPKVQRLWADERARRLVRLANIDAALPKPQ